MSSTSIKIRAAHRVIIGGKTYEQDDFLPDDIDAVTLDNLKFAHAIYEYKMPGADVSAPAEAEPDAKNSAPKKRTQKK